MFLSNISIKRPVFATVLNGVLILFGALAYTKLGIDQFPNVDNPVVSVRVVFPGADPKTIEQKVISPLEKALNGLEGLDTLTAVANPNTGLLTAKFTLERKSEAAVQDVRDAISRVQGQLPQGAQPPTISKFDNDGVPIVNVALSSQHLGLGALSDLADSKVRPTLEKIVGVGQVELVGSRPREVHILLDRAKLQGLDLSPLQFVRSLRSQSGSVPGGKLGLGNRVFHLRVDATTPSVEAFSHMALPGSSAGLFRVSQVAQVVDTIRDETTFATVNGQPSVLLVVYKQAGGNVVAIAQEIENQVGALSQELPPSATLQIVQNNATFIKSSLASVQWDLVFGALLAILIVFIFLRDPRATLISACAIPTSVVGTLAFLYFMGFTLNTMTTLGLTLSIGILVDDTIVVMENIYRRLQQGDAPLQAAHRGAAEIGLAAFAITLSIVAVFFPVAFMDGLIGRFFYQFGLTVAVAVLLSLFVAFTLTPMMASRLLQNPHVPTHPISVVIERGLKSMERGYFWVLQKALSRRRWTLGGALFVFGFSVYLLKFVPVSFFPKEDNGQFFVFFRDQENTSLTAMKKKVQDIEKLLWERPEVERVVATIGAGLALKPNQARLDITLKPKSQRTKTQDEIVGELRPKLKPYGKPPLSFIQINQQAGVRGGGGSQPLQLVLRGDDFSQLVTSANTLREFLTTRVEGAADATTSEPPPAQEVRVVPQWARAADLGLTPLEIGQNLNILFEGVQVALMEDQGALVPVRVRLTGADTTSTAALDGVTLPNARGVPIALSAVANIATVEAPSRVQRMGGLRQVTLSGNYTGTHLRGAVQMLEKEAKRVLPPGVFSQFAGQAKMMEETVANIGKALGLALLMVFMVLCAQLESFKLPLLILTAVPLSFSGAFLALLATGQSLSLYAMIGLILLVGLVTKNAILLVDATLAREVQGIPTREALLEAGVARLRPIVMTTLAMMLGMLPMALGLGVGGDTRAPMAICVMGGLATSTLLTLVVVPCVYSLFGKDLKFTKIS